MRKTKKLLALCLAVMMLAGVMAGCGPKAPAEPTDPAEPSTPVQTGTFDLAVNLASEPQTIDPALNSSVDGAIMLNHFFEGLVKWVDNGKGDAELAPGQAESWEKEVHEDGTATYTFKLRADAKWSDGEPVTAEDFVYSWRRLADPATAADYNYMINMVQGWYEIAEGVETGETKTVVDEETGEESEEPVLEHADPTTLGVSAPDAQTFVVELVNDLPYFEEIAAFPATFPVRSDMIEKGGDQWTFDVATYIGNGPYKMSEWVHNSYIRGVPSETYYDHANLGPDSITFQLMDDANAIYSAFRSGTLQFIEEVPVDEIQSLLANDELHIVDYLGTYYACFNVTKAPFDDVRVREAFSLVIDRNYIVEKVSQTGQVPADGFVPSGMYDAEGPGFDDFRTVGGSYYATAEAEYQANCDKARELLADAGYPNGEGFPAVEYLYNTNDNHRAIGEALQNMWKTELGVDVTLNNQEWGVFLETRKEGGYQISRNGWIADYNDPISFLDMWYTGGGNNDAQYSNKEYDALIDKARASSDPVERMAALHAAEDILMGDDVVHAPIYFYTQKYMLDPAVKGMYYTPLGYFFFGYTSYEA